MGCCRSRVIVVFRVTDETRPLGYPIHLTWPRANTPTQLRRKSDAVPPSHEAILPPAPPTESLRAQYRRGGWGSAIGNTNSFVWGWENVGTQITLKNGLVTDLEVFDL